MSNWSKENDKLVREFQFTDFSAAFAFMTRVAIESEKMGHHPYWENDYNKVRIELCTHEAGNSATQKDHDLADRIDQLV